MKTRYYHNHRGDLPARLLELVDRDELKALHVIDGRRHAVVAARHIALYVGCLVTLAVVEDPRIWWPVAALQGIVILGFIILLHDQVHGVVMNVRRPRVERALGLLYALPSALSATQFKIWHLDHHAELGSADGDPKRAHLTPKIVRRWYKALYMTAGLFLIYARAAGTEAATYAPESRRLIRRERLVNVLLHLALVAGLYAIDPMAVVRAWIVPLFVFFPPAFMINRIGQHYDVRSDLAEAWSTRVDGNPVVRWLFLASNHHIEHHYYPSVPLYHLARLNRALRPFFAARSIQNRGYSGLLWDWFIRNRTPHTDWSIEEKSKHTEVSA